MDSKFSNQASELQKTQESLARFGDLLTKIELVDENVKVLWMEIYENATTDRERASMLYTDLFMDVKGSPEKHAIHGSTLTKYLERMCKSNDQLLRLAEMIERVERTSAGTSTDDIFQQISGK